MPFTAKELALLFKANKAKEKNEDREQFKIELDDYQEARELRLHSKKLVNLNVDDLLRQSDQPPKKTTPYTVGNKNTFFPLPNHRTNKSKNNRTVSEIVVPETVENGIFEIDF